MVADMYIEYTSQIVDKTVEYKLQHDVSLVQTHDGTNNNSVYEAKSCNIVDRASCPCHHTIRRRPGHQEINFRLAKCDGRCIQM